MIRFKFLLDQRTQKKDGSCPIKLYVNGNKRFYVGTGLSCPPDMWCESTYIKKGVSGYAAHNMKLRHIASEMDKYILTMDMADTQVTDAQIKMKAEEIIHGSKRKRARTFVSCMEEFAEKKGKATTKGVYLMTLSKLRQYDPDCAFESMDRKFLENFEGWLSEQGLKTNTIGIHMRNIRAVFNYAIDEEYTTLYPFRRYSIKKEATRKRSLSIEQVRALMEFDCEKHLVRYRDMFMLMFYLIGINAVDLFNAKSEDVVNGRLEYKRSKTGRLYSIKIEPEAQAIIDRYRGKEYLLNIMDEYGYYKDFVHRMNLSLRQIGEVHRAGRGGKKSREALFPDISSYWSRHTWATLAAEIDIPKEHIAQALGHSWAASAVTDIYIRLQEKKVDEANRKVIDYVNSYPS